MDRSKGTTSNLLLNDVLIDAVFCNAIILARDILGSRIEGFLLRARSKVLCSVCWVGSTLTCLAADGVRRWWRRGLLYSGLELRQRQTILESPRFSRCPQMFVDRGFVGGGRGVGAGRGVLRGGIPM